MIATIPTLLPAYDRDYKNKAAILADLNNNKDFCISGISYALINKEQLLMERIKSVVLPKFSVRNTFRKLLSSFIK